MFRSDALQVRVEKRAFGSAGSKTGVMTFVFAYTLNKEYALLCCIGQSWQTIHGRLPATQPQRAERRRW